MKKEDIDWSVIKGSMIMLIVCIVMCSALIAISYYYNGQSERKYKDNKNIFQSISRRYLDIDQEEKLLLEYYPKFIKLYNQGYIGSEKRLNWLEALRHSGETVDVPSLSYSIESQEEFIPAYNINYSGYKLYTSRMELVLGLLHEGDLFNLLNELDRVAEGNYTVNKCNFRMNSREIQYKKDHTNINVTCMLQWITLNLPDGKGIEIL